MKFTKNQTIALSAIALVLVASIAYAIFSTTLKVEGTASTTGEWDIHFIGAQVVDEIGAVNSEIALSSDNKVATLAAPELLQPGAEVTFELIAKNNGSLDAELKEVKITPTNDDPNITISSTAPAAGSTLAAGASNTFNVTVKWNDDSTSGTNNLAFTYELIYEQAE